MCGIVPAIMPVSEPGAPAVGARVLASVGAGISLARPKSSTLTRPSRVTITLAGFKSRCTTPFS
jgi:hypothetical protein